MSTFTLPYNRSNINFYMIVPNALMYHFFHVYDAVMDVKSKYRILVLISVLESEPEQPKASMGREPSVMTMMNQKLRTMEHSRSNLRKRFTGFYFQGIND